MHTEPDFQKKDVHYLKSQTKWHSTHPCCCVFISTIYRDLSWSSSSFTILYLLSFTVIIIIIARKKRNTKLIPHNFLFTSTAQCFFSSSQLCICFFLLLLYLPLFHFIPCSISTLSSCTFMYVMIKKSLSYSKTYISEKKKNILIFCSEFFFFFFAFYCCCFAWHIVSTTYLYTWIFYIKSCTSFYWISHTIALVHYTHTYTQDTIYLDSIFHMYKSQLVPRFLSIFFYFSLLHMKRKIPEVFSLLKTA